LHCPLTAATRGLIGEPQLRAMRPGALLLNTSRGALIDTTALLRALDGGAIAGAALDVTDPEPLPADHPLRGRPDVVITPHSAFSSDGAHAEVAAKAAAGVADVLAGRVPATLVNPEVLDRPSCRLAGAVTG
jgi:D-3-phosphoglycerate dehydrogenase